MPTVNLPEKPWVHTVAEGHVPSYLALLKFGSNPSISTASDPEDIWGYGGLYTYSSSAIINTISSSNAGDTQNILIGGVDTNWDPVQQIVTLNGQNKVVLGTSLLRVNGLFNNSGTALLGTVYVYEDCAAPGGIPGTAANVRGTIQVGYGKSLMAIHSIPDGYHGYLYRWGSSMTGSGVASQFATVSLRIREFGKTFRVEDIRTMTGDGTSSFDHAFDVPMLLEEKTDILIRCDEVSATIGVTGNLTIIMEKE